jgi:hypothetical protein
LVVTDRSPNEAQKRYELWRSPDGCEDYFFAELNVAARDQLDPSFELIWECYAASFTEAQQLKHAHLGWEPYKPIPRDEA